MPPTYTFRRPKKAPKTAPPRSAPPQPRPQKEMYTVIDEEEGQIDQVARYTRYVFFLVLVLTVLFLLAICYIYQRGLPVKIRG